MDVLGDAFPEIKERADHVSTVVEAEEASFGRTLDRGLEIFRGAADRAVDHDFQRIFHDTGSLKVGDNAIGPVGGSQIGAAFHIVTGDVDLVFRQVITQEQHTLA